MSHLIGKKSTRGNFKNYFEDVIVVPKNLQSRARKYINYVVYKKIKRGGVRWVP